MTEPRAWTGASDSGHWEKMLGGLEGSLIFDIGANGGAYTRQWADRFDQVVAVEPNPYSYAALTHGLPSNVTTYNVACSSSPEEIQLYTGHAPHDTSGQYVSGPHLDWADESLTPVIVPAMTLNQLLEIHGVPDVVKIDVEGHEVAVLAGAHDLIAKHATRFLIEVHSDPLGERCRHLLDGYDITQSFHESYRETSEWHGAHYYLDAR